MRSPSRPVGSHPRTPLASAAAIALAAVLAAGCGRSGGSGSPAVNSPASASRAPEAEATAEQVAREARRGIGCPARVSTPSRPAQAPVDDVLGVRPGMTYEEAANVVLCTHERLVLVEEAGRGFQMETHGQKLRQGFAARFARARVQKSSKQIMLEMQDEAMGRGGNRVMRDLDPGEAKWFVTTMGLPGEERVIAAAREEWFPEEASPTMQSVEQALVAKYGRPSVNHDTGSQLMLRWIFDPRGVPAPEGSQLASSCTGATDPDGGVSLQPDCGLVVAANVVSRDDNRAIARFMQVGVTDQARGYAAVTATEQALQRQEEARRATQVQDATRNAAAPRL